MATLEELQAAQQTLRLQQAQAKLKKQAEPDRRRVEAFSRKAFENFTNAMTGIPDLAATLLAQTPTARMGAQLLGKETPRVGERVIPGIPDATDIMAGAQRVGEFAGAIGTGDFQQFTPFNQAREQQQQVSQQLQEQEPGASFGGGLFGDVATIATGRVPLRSGVAAVKNAGLSIPRIPGLPGVKRDLDFIFKTRAARQLGSGLSRAAEVGIEGAMLAALNEGDPKTTALLAAGTQATGSMARFLVERPLQRFAPTIIGATLGLEVFRQLVPGLEQNIFSAKDFAVEKTAGLLLTAGLATVAGMGRKAPLTRDQLQMFGDSIITLGRRGAFVSMIEQLTNARQRGDNTLETVLETISQDPTFFGETARRQIDRAMLNGNLDATVNRLIDSNKQFAERFNSLGMEEDVQLRDAIREQERKLNSIPKR